MEVIPANLGLTDQGLNSIIAEYNAKVVDRKRLLKTAPESSPVVVSATNRHCFPLSGHPPFSFYCV